ncbi:MAG TPA: SPOR domain-containing protein [Solirubrobacteraceae bacterium]|nr:SPOR domain-containing protein [Solirubrobacteraceae bacterium]
MSALAERPPTGTAICPECGAHLAAEQNWCLECGAPVKVRIRSAPDWRVPVAIVGVVVAAAAAILVFALSALTSSANRSVPAVLATAPAHHARHHAAARAAHPPPATAASPTTAVPPAPTIGSWPAGVTGYTVVLGVIPSKPVATASATKIAATGIPVGLLYSSDYSSMHPGHWIVFSGTYSSAAQADADAARLQAKGQTGAYGFPVVPAG